MKLLTISKLTVMDEFSFEIVWSDGIIQQFELKELQRHCPCIRCASMPRLESAQDKTPFISADHIRSVGNYAIQIQFRSGCSSGIYPFSLLRSLRKSFVPASKDL